jgi:hypothetical protein
MKYRSSLLLTLFLWNQRNPSDRLAHLTEQGVFRNQRSLRYRPNQLRHRYTPLWLVRQTYLLGSSEYMIVVGSKRMQNRRQLLQFLVTESLRYAWQWFKNCIKILLGGKSYYDDGLVFFRQFILHVAGLTRIWAITSSNVPIDEGPCSRASLIMVTVNFARVSGLAYLHTPFTIIAHSDRPMPEWVAAWEEFFGFGEGVAIYDPTRRGVINCGYRALMSAELCFGWSDRKQEIDASFKALIPEFRQRYYRNKSRRTTDEVTVAVHIRRGDVSAEEFSAMHTETGKVLRIASAVKSILASHDLHFSIRVFSQGVEADFALLAPLGAGFVLDADPLWTLKELIEADILIVAKSYFSHYAGVISDGIKLFEPELWIWPTVSFLDDWLACDNDGFFDHEAFERDLSQLMRNKREALAS